MARPHRFKPIAKPPPDSAEQRGSTPFNCLGGRFQPSSINVAMLSSETLQLAGYTGEHPPCLIISGVWPQMKGFKKQGFKIQIDEAVRLGRNILQLCIEELNAQRARRRQTSIKNAPAPSGRQEDRPRLESGKTRRPARIGQVESMM